ncbi:hypothetical protein ACFFWC_02115, partial [Plantactinospora siamensis]
RNHAAGRRWGRSGRRRDRAVVALEPYADCLDPGLRGRDLTAMQRQLLGLALAELAEPALVLADDVDAGLSAAERARLWAALADLAARGPAVIVTAREVDPTRDITRYEMSGQS